MAPSSVFQLSGTCNNYPWGKKGKQSLAAQLCAQTPGLDFKIEDDQFYSEMWFGDYPDFPARQLETGEELKDVLAKNKDQLLGKKVVDKFDAQLPYLPKILSIAKALPLQIHPNKELSEKLHAKDPQSFTDPNHKPEIAVALGKFEVFAGFKPLAQIEPLFKLKPLQQFVPEGTTQWTDKTLREVTRSLLKASEDTVKQVQKQLVAIDKSQFGDAGYVVDMLPRLQDQYGPEDAGSLVALLRATPFISPADGIHAYLSGDIVECMARSNNVLNTGFCPPADRNSADLFADTLTFKAHSRDDVYLPSSAYKKSKSGKTVVYAPPMSEPGESDELEAVDGPGVMIVTGGEGTLKAEGKEFPLKSGFIFYVAPGAAVRFETQSTLQVHMAVI
ncbi:phosphomannose isomerase type I [Apiospora aurea]|uniref:Mannose-6-phosphate isomerase n=1 Tax=Apiospora aurea TaxID=335848 RepID=A0ABR1Q1L5_9PEZI